MTTTGESTRPTALDAIETVDDERLEAVLGEFGNQPVLLYFTTSWCAPCKAFGPLLNAYVAAHPDVVRVVRVDGDESPQACKRFDVPGFPTLTMVRNGEQLWLRSGVLSEDELEDWLPALTAAARDLGEVTAPPTSGPSPEPTPTAARETRVPTFADPRVTVLRKRAVVDPGAVVQLEEAEGLQVVFTSDARQSPSCVLGILDGFDRDTVRSVQIQCSDLTQEQIGHLTSLTHLTSLALQSGRPLDPEVVQTLRDLTALRQLYVQAPELDLGMVRAMLPAAQVNFDWTDPRLSALLPHQTAASDERLELPAIALSAPDGFTGIALADNPAQPASDAVLEALVQSGLPARRAGDVAEPAVQAAFRFVGRSEILLFHGGVLVGRRDTCGPHHVAELSALAARAGSLQLESAASTPGQTRSSSPRTVALGVTGAEMFLVPPNATRVDHVVLRPDDQHVEIPAGWSLMARVTPQTTLESLPSDEIDVVEVMVAEAEQHEAVASMCTWPRLTQLLVYMGDWDGDFVSSLAAFTHLHRLDVVARPPEDDDYTDRLRAALPNAVVDNEWSHPAYLI
ncbi:thioredoxin domain-containing protein [Streptomyces sp. NPDC091217]|uniref:thioredoxin domain-containing protein n=1 Tax=Streptomyces sp. NPDC091217 TaxID=3365975 RepID=UPI00381A261C